MTTSTAKNESQPKPIGSKTQWAKLAVHTIQLPSGAWVQIRIPDLTILLLGDAVPEGLRGVALEQVFEDIRSTIAPDTEETKAEPDEEERMNALRRLTELQRWLVVQMVIDPKLEPEDLDKIPSEDLNLLTLIAIRERDRDARGVTIGVDPLSRWELFREELDGLEGGEEIIERLRQRFSTSLLDRV